MKKSYISIILLLSFCILNSTCKKNNDNIVCLTFNDFEDCQFITRTVHDESSSILGKWRYVLNRYAHYGRYCENYCQYNIVFEFKPNNVLTVSGIAEHNNLSFLAEEGENFYSVGLDQWNSRVLTITRPSHNLSTYWSSYRVNSKEFLFQSQGDSHYFIKIK